MRVSVFQILQLGLHVHAAVNQEEHRQTAGKHWRSVEKFMHSRTTDGEGNATEQLDHQRQTAKVHFGLLLALGSLRHLIRSADVQNAE